MTRIAVLSDIHGNTPALTAVLAAVDAEGVDLVLNLGDIVSGAVDPRGTLDLLAERPEIVTVRGNHERQVLTLPYDEMGGSDQVASRVLNDADRTWLGSLPLTVVPVPGVLAFHAVPGDDATYLTQTVVPRSTEHPQGVREATDGELVERLGAAYGAYGLYLCGHTHQARTRDLPDGSLLVNPGSVGWPAYTDETPHPHRVETGSPEARFAIVSQAADGGGWTARLLAVSYDHEGAAAQADRLGRPDVAHMLRTGQVP
ncbi:metallophosphoesterase family protein [Promicromonospora xylanilytica]